MDRFPASTLALVAAIALTSGSTPSHAACSSLTPISTQAADGLSGIFTESYFTPTYVAGYLPFSYSGPPLTPEFEATFWGLGAGAPAVGDGVDSGALDTTAWISSYFNATYGAYYAGAIAGGWGASSAIDGCLRNLGGSSAFDGTECTVVLLADQHAGIGYFALAAALATPSFATYFNQPGDAPIVLRPLDAISIVSSTNLGGGLIGLDFAAPNVPQAALYLDSAGCDTDLIAGYKIYRYLGTPGPERRWALPTSGWEQVGGNPIPLGDPATIAQDCDAHPDVAYAYTLVFDSGFELPFLSADRHASCGMSDPNDLDNDGYPGFHPGGEPGPDCDDLDPTVYPGAPELCNGRDDDCNDLVDDDLDGVDSDLDRVANACDNCRLESNPSQSDTDFDDQGDVCDIDDGRIYLRSPARDELLWDEEIGFSAWNVYRGGLATLLDTGVYTQPPGSNPLAEAFCDLNSAQLNDATAPSVGQAAFYLTSGSAGGIEGGLGSDSAGLPRPNSNSCP